MALDMIREKGVPIDKQKFTWRDLTPPPFSKLDDDAFTRVRVILMNGLEQEANRFQHYSARSHKELRQPLAEVRRVEHHQQTLVNWLLPPDQSPIETTIGYEQVAIEVTASVAMHEPDPYLAQVYRFGLLEDFDHMYRYSALLDRLEGKDANNILQSYTDIRPGRPTADEHRHPADDLREHYDRKTAHPLSKIHALTIAGGEYQTRDYYMNIGPIFTDPVARQLYAEIASIEEQHVTQYESLSDPDETILEKWLLHEAMEVYNYYSCAQSESNPRIKAIWERFVDYELGHLHMVMDLMRRVENRDPEELLPSEIPEPIDYTSHREFVRQTLENEVDFTAHGTHIGPGLRDDETPETRAYRDYLNKDGVPSNIVADRYQWRPGTEIGSREAAA